MIMTLKLQIEKNNFFNINNTLIPVNGYLF